MKLLRSSILVLLVCCIPLLEAAAQWTQVNNGLTNTDVRSLAGSGTNVFAGTWGGGVFYSTNNGAIWTAVNTGLTNSYVHALVISGTNLFAGTEGGGVFLSTNNGTGWTAVNTGLMNNYVSALAVIGTNLFAGTSGGVFLSTNNGTSWTQVNVGLTSTYISCLAVSGTNLFAGGSGVFLSSNSGASWTAINNGLTRRNVLSLVVGPASGGTQVFAGTDSGGVFLSRNNGTSWVKTGLPGVYIRALAIAGTNLFAGTSGGVGVLSGTTWANASLTATTLNPTISSFAVSGTNLFVGTYYYGVYRRPWTDWISLLTPANGMGGIMPSATFTWNANPLALAYAFQISSDAGFSNLVINQYASDTTYTVSSLQLATVYYWRVRAENATWASEWGSGSFTTKLAAAPQLSSPSSGATLVSVTPTLSWNPIVSTASYTIQVSTGLTFDTQVFSVDTTTTSVVLPQLQRSTTYYWRVRAQTVGDTTAWSTASSFTTLPNVPNKITLAYPDSSKQDAYQNDWLIWQADNTAIAYFIQISQGPLFTSIFDSATVKSAGYRNANRVFTSGETYYWRVRGSNVAGDGPFSSVWSFRVGGAVRVSVTSNSSSNLEYGRVKVGQFKDTVVTISNTGNDTLKINNISSSVSVFSVRLTSRTVPPSQSFVDTIRFRPALIGMVTSSVTVKSNSSSGTDTIKVSGFGYGQGVASISAPTVLLGNVKVGQYKDTTIAIANTGNDTLKIASIVSSNLVLSTRIPGRMVPPGQTLIDTIRYAPAEIGTASASIVVTSNSPTSPDTVKVSGFGYGEGVLALSASAISFGNVKVGQFKDTVFSIANSGNDTLKISSISSSISSFSVRSTSATIPPGKSLFIDTLRFTPTSGGNVNSSIVLNSNALTSPDSIKVSGFGLSYGLRFSAAKIDAGLVLLGTYKDTTFTITNTGSDTLKITEISSSAQGITVRPTSFSLLPNGIAIDTVRLTPTIIGPVTGSIFIVSNAQTSPDSVKVTASGVTATTGIAQDGIPSSCVLKQNYPNPFNPSTSINYSLPKTAVVTLKIFNALGQEVALLVNERKEAGYYQATWSANVPSGIYFYQMQAGGGVETKKMILLR